MSKAEEAIATERWDERSDVGFKQASAEVARRAA